MGFLDGFKQSRNQKKKMSGKRSRQFFLDGLKPSTIMGRYFNLRTVSVKLSAIANGFSEPSISCYGRFGPKPSGIAYVKYPNNFGRFGPKPSRIFFLKKYIIKIPKKSLIQNSQSISKIPNSNLNSNTNPNPNSNYSRQQSNSLHI
jgi:hypothetical protein